MTGSSGVSSTPRLLRSHVLWNTGSPASAGDDDDDDYAAAGIGNAVTDLIFSIAKREVTFFSGTEPISFL